jgi:hypothetical protein
MYGMAVACAQKQEIDKAVTYVQKAVDEGLPFARFLAGPRDLLKPLTSSPEFKTLAEKYAMETAARSHARLRDREQCEILGPYGQ